MKLSSFSFMRHGRKFMVGERMPSLSKAGLNKRQKKLCDEVCALIKVNEPPIDPAEVVRIGTLAEKIAIGLPLWTTLLLASSDLPRTRFTAEVLQNELEYYSLELQKQIAYCSIDEFPRWKSSLVAKSKIADEDSNFIVHRVMPIVAPLSATDAGVRAYCESGANLSHPREAEFGFEAANNDLAADDSYLIDRAENLMEEVHELKHKFQSQPVPPNYFLAVGHFSGLIAFDVAFRGRLSYKSVDQLPQPLDIYGYDPH